ncbi:PREDICTED: reverse mRNAase, partial [Prunus dulcis]
SDFNEMLSVDDKLGGAVTSRVQGFCSWFDNHGMVDLGFSGPKYTWRNTKVSERIGRAICTMNWRGLYADAH